MTNAFATGIAQTALDFRTALARREAAAATVMLRAYAVVERRLQADLDALLAKIAATDHPTPDRLRREARYKELLQQVEAEVARFSTFAEGVITDGQRAAAAMARTHAVELLEAAVPGLTFNRLPTAAIEGLAGVLADGSPLAKLLDTIAPQTVGRVKDSLLSGLASGRGVAGIARDIRQDIGGSAVRALLIARTETMRAYRSAALGTYRLNSDVVNGWEWLAALTPRTCAFCTSMHGTFHALDEDFVSHPACRCTAIPVTKSWEALGL